MYKMMIDSFIETNFNSLNKIASTYCIGTQMPPKDLVMELVIYLYTKEKKVTKYLSSDSSLIRFSKKWLWNQTKLYTKNKGLSNFKSKFQIFETPLPEEQTIEWDGTNFSLKSEPEIHLSKTYNEEQVKKIIFTKEYVDKLNEVEKRLFELHYEQRMSHVKIAKYLQEKYNQKVSPSSVYNMIVNLRKKIKEAYGNN